MAVAIRRGKNADSFDETSPCFFDRYGVINRKAGVGGA